MKNKSYRTLLFAVFITFTSFAAKSQVLSKGISFQGVIKTPSGQFPTISGTTVLVKILSPNDCILREETFSGVNISNGYLNLSIGRGTPTSNNPDPARDLKAVMNNSDAFSGLSCLLPDGSLNANKTTYEPQSGDVRKLRVSLEIDQHTVVADFNMRAVAYAINAETAENSRKLGNKTADEFLQTNLSKQVTQQHIEEWFSSNVMGQILSGSYNAPTATSATTLSTVLPVNKGGTGGTTAAAARTNLELGPLAIKPLGDASMVLYGDGNWKSLPAGNMGTVYSLSAGTGLKTNKVSNAPITDSGEVSVDVGTAPGQIVQVQSGGKLPALDGSQVTNVNAVSVAPSAVLEMTKDIKTTENLQAAKSVTAKTLYVFDQVLPSPNSVGLKAPADMSASGGASYILTLPDRKGAPGQVLAAKDSTGALEWISPSVGSVTSVLATAPIAVTAGATPQVSLNLGAGLEVASNNLAVKYGTVAGTSLQGNQSLDGDVTGVVGATSVGKIQGRAVAATAPSNGQVLKWNNTTSSWEPAVDANTDAVSSVAGRTGAVVLSSSDVSGLGTAASLNAGTAASNLVQLDGSAKIPSSLLPNSVLSSSSAAGGDLTGTYPNPTIANSTVTSAKIADGAVGNLAKVVNAPGSAGTNRLLATDTTTGTMIKDFYCTTVGHYLKWTGATGFGCAGIASADISDATSSNNANTVIKRDPSGNFSAGTITAKLNGSVQSAIASKTSNYTVQDVDNVLLGNAASNTVTFTLPSAIGMVGREFTVKKIDSSSNSVTVSTSGGQTIDGAASSILNTRWQTITVISDGANWLIKNSTGTLSNGTYLAGTYNGTDLFAQKTCASGDYYCQAKAACEFATGATCAWQSYTCSTYPNQNGSFYPTSNPRSMSISTGGSSNLNWAVTSAWTVDGNNTTSYGNLCSCSNPTNWQKNSHPNCGVGRWEPY